MDKLTGGLLRTLKMDYLLFWGVMILLFIAFETGLVPSGSYAGDVRMEYILQTAGILLMIVLVPLSLKLFGMVLRKKIDRAALEPAIGLYRKWSHIRLALLLLAGVYNLVTYYLTLNSACAFCVMIVLLASLFCLPGKGRVAKELRIGEGEHLPD